MIPPFLSYIFDGLVVCDFNRFYSFVKINKQRFKVPNLIVPFMYVRR